MRQAVVAASLVVLAAPLGRADVPGAWKDCHDVLKEAVKRFPDSKCLRTHYAKWAAKFGKWDEADEQLQKVDDDVWRPLSENDAQVRAFVEEVRANAKAKK
jgi:hypothetical protein